MPPSRPAPVSSRDTSVLLTAEQLLRGPASESSRPRHEIPPRSLSNEALLASLRPPLFGHERGSQARELRRSMEPHLVDGLSWFMERAPWQRALLSSGLGALVGVGIVLTLGRLVMPELAPPAIPQAPARAAAAIVVPAAEPPREPPAAAAPVVPESPPPVAVQQQPEEVTEALAPATPALSDEAPAAKPAAKKSKRRAKHAKRSRKAKARARKPAALPARWAELYSRER